MEIEEHELPKEDRVETRKPLLPGWLRAILIIIPYLFTLGIFQLIGTQIAGLPLDEVVSPTLEQNVIMMVFTVIGAFIIVGTFVYGLDKSNFAEIGFRLKGRMKDIIAGLLIGTIIMAIGFYILYITGQIIIEWNVFNPVKLLLCIILFILVSLHEELVFRGYILNNLMQSMNRHVALFVCAIAFSLVHIFNPSYNLISFINIFLAGILLGICYIYTKNLWFALALHFSWNFIQAMFGFHVSGTDSYNLILQSRSQDTVWNGGAFGFEGSLLCTLFSIITIIGILLYYEKKESKNKG